MMKVPPINPDGSALSPGEHLSLNNGSHYPGSVPSNNKQSTASHIYCPVPIKKEKKLQITIVIAVRG